MVVVKIQYSPHLPSSKALVDLENGTAKGCAPIRADLRDGLGRGRLGPRSICRPRTRASTARRGSYRRIEWRPGPKGEDSCGTELPGPIRGHNSQGGQNDDRRSRFDYRPGPGQRGHHIGDCGLGVSRPRDAPGTLLVPQSSTGAEPGPELAGPARLCGPQADEVGAAMAV